MTRSASFWDRRADRYARQPIKDTQSYERTLDRTRAYLSENDEVLEIGCGTGTTALLLARSVRQLIACDVSSRMLEIAREKAADQGVSNVRFVRADVPGNLPEGGPFDAILAFNLLHLLEDIPATLRALKARLKPGGWFVSKTVCMAEHSRLWGLVFPVMRLVGLAPGVHLMKIAELERQIAGAGFEIVETGSFPASPPSRFVVARNPAASPP